MERAPLDPGGSFSVLPFSVPEETVVGQVQIFGPTPWGVPGAMGVPGRRRDGRTVLSIIYESPLEVFSVREPISKEQEERLQLERLRSDDLRRGIPLAGPVRRGGEPPDFLVTTPTGDQGLDFTRFSIQDRMHAQAQFRRLRSALLEEPREDFAHLFGTTVYLWFDDQGFSSLPQRSEKDLEALITALRDYEFDPDLTVGQVVEGLPPELDIQKSESGRGAHFFATPMAGGSPSSLFYLATGFELGLGYQTEHDIQGAWKEVHRLVGQHDQPGIDVLVMSVGSPDRNGLIYPSETFLMSFALESELPGLTPEHLKAVHVHFWADGTLIQLYPFTAGIRGPTYSNFFPAHFSTAPVEVSAQGVEPDS